MADRDWQALPCREFCNARGCQPGDCRNPYPRDDPRHWLGRGSEDVSGKSFGWAHNMESRAIRDHLIARGESRDYALYFRIIKIRMRLQRDYHRRKPPIGARRIVTRARIPEFTREELEMIAARFDGANDPIGQAIERKARSHEGRNES